MLTDHHDQLSNSYVHYLSALKGKIYIRVWVVHCSVRVVWKRLLTFMYSMHLCAEAPLILTRSTSQSGAVHQSLYTPPPPGDSARPILPAAVNSQ